MALLSGLGPTRVRLGTIGEDARKGLRRQTRNGNRRASLALLEITNLHVALEDGTEIVKGVDLAIDTNEKHAVMGPNGSGKSTFAYALMGHPAYEITEATSRSTGSRSSSSARTSEPGAAFSWLSSIRTRSRVSP